MAIQTLGIKMVINGAMKVARDLYTVSSSLYQMSRATSGVQIALAAFRLAITATTTTVDIFFTALTIGLGALKSLFNILTKIAGIAFNGVKTVFNILWNIISLPFKIAISGLSSLWESLKRIGEIAIGMNLSNLIWHLGTQIKDIGSQAFEAAGDFQLLEVRMRGLIQRELAETGGMSFSESMGLATEKTKELTYWISNLAVKSIFNAETIANTVTLAMAYDFTTKEAQNLTEAIANFATGMGLGNTEMQRIVENFGQMRAQGKLTGTELRDLARGAFVPVNEVAKEMLINLGYDITKIKDFRTTAADLVSRGKASVDDYFKAFISYTGKNFPDAVGKASASMKVVTSNIQDFIQTIIGWRVIKPSLDEISGRLSNLLQSFLGPEARKLGENIGSVFKFITKGIFKISDALSPKALKNTEGLFKTINNKLFQPLKDFVAGTSTFDAANRKVNSFLSSIFTKLKPESIIKISTGITKLASAFNNLGLVPVRKSFQDISSAIGDIAREIWDSIIFPAAQDFWNDTIKPKLLEVWGYVYGFLKEIWEKKIPDWWKNTGEPAVIKMLGQISGWITKSPLLQEVGRIIVNGIASGMTAVGNSGILEAATGLITSALQGAAAAGLQALSGALQQSNENDIQGTQNFDTHFGGNQQGGNKPKMFQGIIDAINRLKDTARQALDTALIQFNTTILDIVKNSNGDYTGLNQFTQIVLVLGEKGVEIGLAISTISESIKTLGINIGTDNSKYSGFAKFLSDLLGIAIAPLNSLAGALKFLADSIKLLGDALAYAGVVMGGGGTTPLKLLEGGTDILSSLNKLSPQNLFKDLFSGQMPEISPNSILGGFTKLIQQLGKDGEKAAQDSSNNIKKSWQTLSNDLIGNSIIPDMMIAIYNTISTKLTETSEWISTGFINPVLTMFEGMNLFEYGVQMMTTLRAGLESQAAGLLAWFQSFASKFRINASVNVTQTTTTTTTANPVQDTFNNQTETGEKYGAKGLNFVVPAGYPNDAYTVKVSSGEQVIVIPNALKSMFARSGSNAAWSYNTAGAMYSNNTTNNMTRVYNLNVNSNRTLESLSTEFGIIRLLGENYE